MWLEVLRKLSFNSMIVRLKAAFVSLNCINSDVFQFYDSPIKRPLVGIEQTHALMFQFYDSPIKRSLRTQRSALLRRFQFYDSPIKRQTAAWDCCTQYGGFNSMIVRLKGFIACRLLENNFFCFNSMIVRLKDDPNDIICITSMFQFYDSPIKRQ